MMRSIWLAKSYHFCPTGTIVAYTHLLCNMGRALGGNQPLLFLELLQLVRTRFLNKEEARCWALFPSVSSVPFRLWARGSLS